MRRITRSSPAQGFTPCIHTVIPTRICEACIEAFSGGNCITKLLPNFLRFLTVSTCNRYACAIVTLTKPNVFQKGVEND